MISNQILQKTIDELKELSNSDMAVLDLDGKVAVRTFTGKALNEKKVVDFVASDLDIDDIEGYKVFKIKEDSENEYVLAVKGTSNSARIVGRMARYQIETLLVAYKERYDKDNFIRALILDNLLLVDIYGRSKKLHIESELRRVVFIVQTQTKNQDDAIGTIRNIFAGSTDDFVTAIDKKNLIIVKHVDDDADYDSLEQIARKINMALKSDIEEEAYISYGTIVSDLKEISKSYKEAKLAIEVGKIFFEERKINAYTKLGIGRLIFQLPLPLCRLFIEEIFGSEALKDLDEETLNTINKFLECSLNVSETSRQLFIHRNTLVYRLDKIQKTMGLDLRQFDDAITFKIALMVSKYMKYIEGDGEK